MSCEDMSCKNKISINAYSVIETVHYPVLGLVKRLKKQGFNGWIKENGIQLICPYINSTDNYCFVDCPLSFSNNNFLILYCGSTPICYEFIEGDNTWQNHKLETVEFNKIVYDNDE